MGNMVTLVHYGAGATQLRPLSVLGLLQILMVSQVVNDSVCESSIHLKDRTCCVFIRIFVIMFHVILSALNSVTLTAIDGHLGC